MSLAVQRRLRQGGQTLAEIARAIGISRQAVSQYAHGDSIPTLYTAARIAQYLGCTLDELAGFRRRSP
uniref:Putative DNA binding, helix-turn-helix domain containing protein n=1 Tax=viral metagenome TaxID=1070528 RepID=A0A6M3J0S2_9ZZZZ